MDTPTFNILEVCAGVGGLGLGVKLAIPSARTVVTVEREAACCEVLATRGEEGCLDEAPNWSDVKTFDGQPWRGIVDCVVGGYPCQPFSLAGKRRGCDDPRHLWPDIARIIREVEPAYCFFENVSNHLNLGFDLVARELEEMGYKVEAGLFSAEEIGAPHKRERLFILAFRKDSLGNSNGKGLQKSELIRERQLQAETGKRLDDRSERPNSQLDWSRELDHTSSARCEQRERVCGDDLGSFPPGPADLDAWRQILAERPDLAPAISEAETETEPILRKLADGLANRVDMLRACGNGVVPLVAAYALILLIASVRARCIAESKQIAGMPSGQQIQQPS